MSWYDFVRRSRLAGPTQIAEPPCAPCEEAKVLNVELQTSAPVLQYLPPTYLRRGKWVKTPQGIGIVTDLSNVNFAEVMLTDRFGADRMSVRVGIADIQLARIYEIPEPRRPDPAAGAQRGYI